MDLAKHLELIASSYERLTGKHLLNVLEGGDIVEAFSRLPFAIVAHNSSPDPIFFYANAKALELFEMTWEEFTALPSRLSAEPGCQLERERILQSVKLNKFSEDYSGVRISKNGRRFKIENATIWNLEDEEHGYVGQAAALFNWQFLSD